MNASDPRRAQLAVRLAASAANDPGEGAARPVSRAGMTAAIPGQAAAGTTATPLPAECDTLARLFAWRASLTPEQEAYREFDQASRRWIGIAWREAGMRMRQFEGALAALDIGRGERVALLLPNSVDTVCIDQAALARACVCVPLHALDNPQSIAFILADSGATLLVAASDQQWRAIAAAQVPLPALRWVVVLRRESPLVAAGPGPTPMSVDEWLAAAAPARTPDNVPAPAQAGDLAAIVYTSGTTGRPKGVMLTHANVIANVRSTLQRVAPRDGDLFLSFLPLSHTFERTVGYYLPIAAGCCVAFARSVADLAQDLRSVRPTILVSVPRIYERVQAQIATKLATTPVRRALFGCAARAGWRRFRRARGLASPAPLRDALRAPFDALAWPLLDRLAGAPLRAQFGGRLRIAVSGGAPLSQAIAQAFIGLGIPIVQGYGMTETSPVVAANAPDDNDPATVGRVLEGVEVRIGENRELLVRGESVMRGYWKREGDTAAAFIDGWLRTGDQAAIENGRLRILGRLKEILVTSTGEKVAPADVELAIAADPLFEQVFVLGEGRPFIACIVALNAARWAALATALALDPAAPGSLAMPAVLDAAMERIRRQTREFPTPGQPRRVILSLEPWTVENSLMTPTLKLKRTNLAARFAAQIDALYAR